MTARFSSKVFFAISVVGLFLLSLVNIYSYIHKKPQIIVIDTIDEDLAFWENIQKNNPTYRDAYVVLSEIKSKEGDVLGAQTMIEEALEVDPFAVTQQGSL